MWITVLVLTLEDARRRGTNERKVDKEPHVGDGICA